MVMMHRHATAWLKKSHTLDGIKTSLCQIRDVFWPQHPGAGIRYQTAFRIQMLRHFILYNVGFPGTEHHDWRLLTGRDARAWDADLPL